MADPSVETTIDPMAQLRRNVTVGGKSRQELRHDLEAAGVRLNEIGLKLFANPRFSTREKASTVVTVQVTVAELGLANGGTFAEVTRQASSNGLALCPLELGPHLRLQLLDQDQKAAPSAPTSHTAPPGSITVFSEPPAAGEDEPYGFYLRRINGTLWLRGYTSGPGHIWRPQDTLVFTSASNAG